jgi:LPS export ABC transporter protein LptC
MDRVAAGITLGVILFVTVVIGVLIVRGHQARVPREKVVSSQADQQIKEIHLQEDAKSGAYHWSLDAEQAETYPGTGKTFLRKVTIRVEDADRRWKVTSDEGDLIQDTRDVELRGHVVLISSEGMRVETTVLKWLNAEGKASTAEPVTIYRSGGVVKGTGLEATPSQETTVVRGRLTATFSVAKGDTSTTAPKSKL